MTSTSRALSPSTLLLSASLALALLGITAAFTRTAAVRAASTPPTFNHQTAAAYLDQREQWWQQWAPAQKEHGTVCISCHTTIPYAMARPALGSAAAPTPAEKVLFSSVETRVANWSEMIPFYSDARNGPGKTAQSHATEAVLNAAILASHDARLHTVRPITQTAFDNAWALQQTDGPDAGGWIWQDFHLGPWESGESTYQGAALLLVQALALPPEFAANPANHKHLEQLTQYLRREYPAQPILNQIYVLWASAHQPDLLTPADRKALLSTLAALEQPDGGWRTTSIATVTPRERADKSPAPTESDGYATALIVLALESSGNHTPSLTRGLTWLTQHQQSDGTWKAASLNKNRDPESDAYRFMQDAATAYAVLALEQAKT